MNSVDISRRLRLGTCKKLKRMYPEPEFAAGQVTMGHHGCDFHYCGGAGVRKRLCCDCVHWVMHSSENELRVWREQYYGTMVQAIEEERSASIAATRS